MSIKWLSPAWRSALQNTFPPDRRVYVDFRQKQYPIVAGAPTFTLITSADNQPGSHNLTGGYGDYLLDMPSKLIIAMHALPSFSYTGGPGNNTTLFNWTIDANHFLLLQFNVTSHRYQFRWKDGTNTRELISSAYGSDVAFQVWTDIALSIDLTTGTAAGSELYVAGSIADSSWDGAIDVKARNFPILRVRADSSGNIAGYSMNNLRFFSGRTCTAADVANNFRDLKDEEVVWHFNGHPTGHTRCNVTSRTRAVFISKAITSPIGNFNPNTASVQLLSPQGQFADDQYAAFAPASEIYNGTAAQSYMKQRCPVEIETWYQGLFELEFVGRVDANLFRRRSSFDTVSGVTISAADFVDEMKRRVRQKAYSFDSYNLCDPSTPAASLVHVIAQMATQPEWFNFLGNSSFENATIANSWKVVGAGATLTRAAGGLLGGFQADWAIGAGGASYVEQYVTFTGSKKLNVGQIWNVSIYYKSAGVKLFSVYLYEYAGAVAGASIHVDVTTVAGTNWKKAEIAYTIAGSTSDRLRVQVYAAAGAATISIDCAMLVQRGTSLDWFVLNSNDGTAGTISADSAMSAVYDTAGFDVDDAVITHPWAIVDQGVPIFGYLGQIGDATAARYMGIDTGGTFKYRTPFKAGYADPSSLLTITAVQSIDSTMEIQQANKFVIHGNKVAKDGRVTQVWSGDKTSFFDRTTAGSMYDTVLNGAQWPDPTLYGEFWAPYDGTVMSMAAWLESQRIQR